VLTFPPEVQTACVVFVSSHSGRAYPAEFIASARLDARALRRSEDGFVDELFAAAPGYGAPLVTATFPRAYCDPNREAWELDPAMFAEPLPGWVNASSRRVAAGLGTIAKVVAAGESIYRDKLPFAQAEHRVRACWQPFHNELEAQVAATVARFGRCLLVDCHSMPAQTQGKHGAADFVLGDAHGSACAPAVTEAAERFLAGHGFAVRLNDPYAGGYITRHYGKPALGVHAMQIEIARRLYMNEALIERGAGFGRIQALATKLIELLTQQANGLMR
jgi:N-formylglutamate deformylase